MELVLSGIRSTLAERDRYKYYASMNSVQHADGFFQYYNITRNQQTIILTLMLKGQTNHHY